jgi:4-hydroxythreonine-4-phosphate dehydrogenase
MKIVVTSGEPAGIGPDLCALLSDSPYASDLTVLGDAAVIASRAAIHGCDVSRLHIEHVKTPNAVVAGHLDVANAHYVLNLLDRAVAGCQSGEYAAMVTAPALTEHVGVVGVVGQESASEEVTNVPLVPPGVSFVKTFIDCATFSGPDVVLAVAVGGPTTVGV